MFCLFSWSVNCSGGDPPFLGGYGLGFYCLAEFCLVWIRSLHVCVVGFIIMGNRRTTHPEGSNCDTMTPPVHSHSPQTHTFFQTLNPRCCCPNGFWQCWTGGLCSSSDSETRPLSIRKLLNQLTGSWTVGTGRWFETTWKILSFFLFWGVYHVVSLFHTHVRFGR